MTAVLSVEVHHGLAARAATGLPLRAILGHWTRELGVIRGRAVWPGPRNNPGNVTRAHVGKVCSYLEGGSATERHRFPVFCTPAEGVREYAWYFNTLRYYSAIAKAAAGSWQKACDLIERSPWSSDHYGGTIDRTAATLTIRLVAATVHVANVRSGPGRSFGVVTRIGHHGAPLAYIGDRAGEVIGGNGTWHRVLVGAGNGRTAYIHSSVADVVTG